MGAKSPLRIQVELALFHGPRTLREIQDAVIPTVPPGKALRAYQAAAEREGVKHEVSEPSDAVKIASGAKRFISDVLQAMVNSQMVERSRSEDGQSVYGFTEKGMAQTNFKSDVFDDLLEGEPLPPVEEAGLQPLAELLPVTRAEFDALVERVKRVEETVAWVEGGSVIGVSFADD